MRRCGKIATATASFIHAIVPLATATLRTGKATTGVEEWHAEGGDWPKSTHIGRLGTKE